MKTKAIQDRRSIRHLTDEVVSKEALANILQAADYTPTSMNTQAIKLVVVERGAIKGLKEVGWNQPQIDTASHIIFIYAVKRDELSKDILREALSYVPEENREKSVDMAYDFYRNPSNQDISGAAHAIAATMSYEATANDVASVIMSGWDYPKVSQLLEVANVPKEYELITSLAIGIKKPEYTLRPRITKQIDKQAIFIKK